MVHVIYLLLFGNQKEYFTKLIIEHQKQISNLSQEGNLMLIPMAMWYKVSVCGRPFIGIADSNPAGDMDVCLPL
jgi:hypothetical protein